MHYHLCRKGKGNSEVEAFSKVTRLRQPKQQSWDPDSRPRAGLTMCFLSESPEPRQAEGAGAVF